MSTFYIKFQVVPTEHNLHYQAVEKAYASCWVQEELSQAALNKARFFIAKDEWKITETEPPIEVSRHHFEGRDLATEQYDKAQEHEIAIVYIGVSRDGVTESGPVHYESPKHFDLNSYINRQKKLTNKGRCLHFESGERCGKIISAHSIQQNGQLSSIASKGHVYSVARDIGSFRKSQGRISLEKRGIGTVSTFLGFCDKHDNYLFSAIDKMPLAPTHEQAFLYAYRSLCRELFVKENALAIYESVIAGLPEGNALKNFFEGARIGTSYGLKNLQRHKSVFDESLTRARHLDIEYAVLFSHRQPNVAFSGVLYPEFDFLGRPLQDLADHSRQTDLITFSSAKTSQGWGFLFAWHKSSTKTCSAFIRSFATKCHVHKSNGGDEMFRLVISNCENLAISPAWWDGLTPERQHEVTARMSSSANFFTPTSNLYLAQGLEGICGWEFESVVSDLA